jgi:selenide,water dikinase
MAALNKKASEVMGRFAAVSACTDITGFGLLGHIAEMIHGTETTVTIEVDKVPFLAEAYEFGAMGFVPMGAHRNRTFREEMVAAPADFDPVLRDILFDPQTSGGLLVGCAEDDVFEFLNILKNEGVPEAEIVGYVSRGAAATIQIA